MFGLEEGKRVELWTPREPALSEAEGDFSRIIIVVNSNRNTVR